VEVGAADEVEVEVVEVATVDDEEVVDDEADDVEDELDDAGAAATALKTLSRQLPPQV
jgi:precorrin-4 methylase